MRVVWSAAQAWSKVGARSWWSDAALARKLLDERAARRARHHEFRCMMTSGTRSCIFAGTCLTFMASSCFKVHEAPSARMQGIGVQLDEFFAPTPPAVPPPLRLIPSASACPADDMTDISTPRYGGAYVPNTAASKSRLHQRRIEAARKL